MQGALTRGSSWIQDGPVALMRAARHYEDRITRLNTLVRSWQRSGRSIAPRPLYSDVSLMKRGILSSSLKNNSNCRRGKEEAGRGAFHDQPLQDSPTTPLKALGPHVGGTRVHPKAGSAGSGPGADPESGGNALHPIDWSGCRLFIHPAWVLCQT